MKRKKSGVPVAQLSVNLQRHIDGSYSWNSSHEKEIQHPAETRVDAIRSIVADARSAQIALDGSFRDRELLHYAQWHEPADAGLFTRLKRKQSADAYFSERLLDSIELVESSLLPLYRFYVATVSNAKSAASIGSCGLICALSVAARAERVLDMGSGFSSAALRMETDAEVVSVDHHKGWLAKTKDFLAEQGLAIHALHHWAQFKKEDHGRFDLVFNDLGGGIRNRAQTLTEAFRLVKPGGYLVVDDVHKVPMRKSALAIRRQEKMTLIGPSIWTLDEFGRYAWVLKRAPE